MNKSRLLGAVCACVLILSGNVNAALVAIQPGPTDGKDALLRSGSPWGNSNFGNLSDMIVAVQYPYATAGLIEFDLSAIPSNSTITSATLSLFQINNSNLGRQYDVFRVTSEWEENVVTYYSAPTYDPVAAASLTIPDNLTGVYRDWDITNLVSGWLDGSFDNYGMRIEKVPLVVPNNYNSFFRSSDDPILSQRPILTVEYSAVPIPAALWLFGSGLLGLAGMARRKAQS